MGKTSKSTYRKTIKETATRRGTCKRNKNFSRNATAKKKNYGYFMFPNDNMPFEPVYGKENGIILNSIRSKFKCHIWNDLNVRSILII
jgi:hypothetical protein